MGKRGKPQQKLLIIGASIRNCGSQALIVEAVEELQNEPQMYEYIEECARARRVSNTEGCAIAAAYGARQEGVAVEYLRLNKYINRAGKLRNAGQLLDRLAAADAYLFLSPVYFGDRTSLLFELFSLLRRRKVSLEGKVSGMISVGAKRNGGQETTNVYTLFDLQQMGSVIVGNGPPTSQYGGTAVGGNMGTMDNDYFGIMTSMGVGKKTARTVRLLQTQPTREKRPRISFWVLEDYRDGRMRSYLENLLPSLPDVAEWSILDLTTSMFGSCIACSKCPNRPEAAEYRCCIVNDDMRKMHRRLLANDGFVICGLNYVNEARKLSNYQRFVERTRYLRRDDFRFTDIPFCSLSIEEPQANNLFDLKVMTSFMRHNTVAHKGVRVLDIGGELLEPDASATLGRFANLCARSLMWRGKQADRQHSYDPVGYEA